MTALYGPAQADVHMENINRDNDETVQVASTITRSLKTREEMEAYLKDEYADTPILVDVARCESTFKQFHEDGKVVRGRVDRDDIGVMQINERYHGETAEKLGIDIYTVDGNIAYAKYLYDKFGTKPWSASKPCWSKPHGDIAMK
jgi:ABC-type Fe3+-citrate transport system substrate-binding protein